MMAAIASSVWLSYEKQGKVAFNEDSIKHFIIQCEVSILIESVYTFKFINSYLLHK